MIKDLQGAMREEQRYIDDRMSGIDTNLTERLKKYGYSDLSEYFTDKKSNLFAEWKPSVHYIDEDYLDSQMEQDIIDCNDGIYIIVPKSKRYAFHGSDEINREECESIGIRVIEMGYRGGTIVGSADDLGILLVIPFRLMITPQWVMENVLTIVREYIPEAEIIGNDIVVDGQKVMGSMVRQIGKSIVWAAQFTFGEHDKFIRIVCKKETKKEPGRIDSGRLTRNALEGRLVKWLRNR